MEYLGFWVTSTGIRPINKKVEAIVNMRPPKNTREVHVFVVLVNYYRDMWDKRSHLLHTLTSLTSNKVEFNGLIWDRNSLMISSALLPTIPYWNIRISINVLVYIRMP